MTLLNLARMYFLLYSFVAMLIASQSVCLITFNNGAISRLTLCSCSNYDYLTFLARRSSSANVRKFIPSICFSRISLYNRIRRSAISLPSGLCFFSVSYNTSYILLPRHPACSCIVVKLSDKLDTASKASFYVVVIVGLIFELAYVPFY